MKMSII